MCLEDEFKSVEEQYFSDCLEECLPIVSDESDAFSSPEVSEALQLSLQDIEEEQTLSQFLEKPCCTNGCNTVIPEERIVFARNNFLELQKDEQDLVILSQIQSGKGHDDFNDAYKDILAKIKYGRKSTQDSSKGHVLFYFHQLPICRKMFLFLHVCGLKRYKSLLAHFDRHGVVMRIHASKNKPCTNPAALHPEEITKVVDFIKSTADQLAIPLPGRMPRFKDYKVMKLPSSETKSSLYRTYISSLQPEDRKLSNQSFRKIWNLYVPYITIMKPSDDLCDVCRGIFKIIYYYV